MQFPVLLTLLGLKPALDGYRIVRNVPQGEGQHFDHSMNFAMTRIGETTIESLFQAFMQALALARSEKPGLRQVISLLISCLSVANTFMCVAHDLDMNKNFRLIESVDYGFIPSGPRGNLVCVALFVFGLCYLASKLIAVGILGSMSFLALGACFAGEAVLLLLVRMALSAIGASLA